jgi:uncharacterized damage-inducible protein DinB
MSIAKEFLAEFEAQSPITSKFLQRVPADKLTWKPHEKSLTAGQLALHIAKVPAGILRLVQNNPAEAPGKFNFPQPATLDEILTAFAESAATVRGLLPSFNDAAMQEPWALKFGDRVLVEQPRADFLRDIMFSHVYQHRGQLSVYLRLLDVPVPSSWGPSADEAPNFSPREVLVA